MAINTAGTVVALIASSTIASMFSMMIYNLLFRDNIVNGLTQATQNITTSDPMQAAAETWKVVSNFTLNAFSLLKIDQKGLADTLHRSVLGIPDTVEEMIRPHAVKMISSVLTMILYLLMMIVVAFLAKKLSKGINRTFLKTPNRVLGILVGVAEAVLVSMVIGLIVYFVMMFISPETCKTLREAIDQTVFYRLIQKINLPEKIISWISSLW